MTADQVLEELANEIADHMTKLSERTEAGCVTSIGDLPNPYEVLGRLAAMIHRHRVLGERKSA